MATPVLLVGEDGPAVLIPARVARRIAPTLSAALHRARTEGQTIDAEVADVVVALERAGRVYAAARVTAGGCSVSGTSEVPLPTGPAMVAEMTTRAASDRLGCTPRAVVALIGRQRLQARRTGRAWMVDAVSVRELLEERAG